MKTQNRLQFPAILLAVFLVLIVTSCEIDKDENKPVVVTVDVTEIKSKEALCSGLIISDGGYAITACGVCWSTEQNPTIDDNKTTDSIGAGSFSSQITGLQPKENYYVRAYATNSEGTGYGMAIAFETIGATELTTTEVTEISYTFAVCGGNITSDGGYEITARGVCWSTSPDSVELEKASGFTVNGSGIGAFESRLANITPNTTYYIRAYATNSLETNYGNIISFQTKAPQYFTDSRDGNVYQYISIGSQVWMAENLKYLPSVVRPDCGSTTTAYYYVYGYYGTNVSEATATENYQTYGVLYNWPAAMAGSESSDSNPSGVQGVCPTGWHLPSDAEWTTITTYLGETVAGSKLKETGTTHWNSPNAGATNETGFTALPGGNRSSDGAFGYIGSNGYWWSATELHPDNAWHRGMYYGYSDVGSFSYDKELGFSVRCLKD
jgi:uncharacterized protein (TIGR02145 family)